MKLANPKCSAWQIEETFRAGLAGGIVFSFTDEWHRGGEPITDWEMGLTTRERKPKPSFNVVQQSFQQAPPSRCAGSRKFQS